MIAALIVGALVLSDEPSCADCHPAIVASYAKHGMARALAPMTPEFAKAFSGQELEDHASGMSFGLLEREGRLTLIEHGPGPAEFGPHRLERAVVAMVGAGLMDRSFVLEHVDRLFFAPVEWATGHGLVLAPHQELQPSSRLGFALARDCLDCHTDPAPIDAFPRHLALGVEWNGIGCSGCHGDASEHIASGGRRGTITDLGALPPLRQHDVCARCHLQGDARIDLAPPGSAPFAPGDSLFQRRATLVTAAPDDEFGFVSQSERLALSRCFVATDGALTCTTCHDPHESSFGRGFARSDAACASCHATDRLPRTPDHAADAQGSCTQCHMRKSAPHDLRHVAITDHWIRTRPPAPAELTTLRVHTAGEGPLTRFRWLQATPTDPAVDEGAIAMAEVHLHRMRAAAARFDGLRERVDGSALARWSAYHFYRGRAYEAVARADDAIAAYRTAIQLEPDTVEARVNLGLLLALRGDPEALTVLDRASRIAPAAESPWQNKAVAAATKKDLAGYETALAEALARNPDLAPLWIESARVALGRRQLDVAHRAATRAVALQPRLEGAWTLLGQTLFFAGDKTRARAAFEEALRQDPKDADAARGMQLTAK
ncbi:MAG: tetratricopeptide repeat protein [Planctomycetes bacterium]|nr:tetratricopeptide repeat protein [Planctomycetota bacterium]MCC7168827.1 tetratricopeptide repeat protein [Planctomycetota bacterium]